MEKMAFPTRRLPPSPSLSYGTFSICFHFRITLKRACNNVFSQKNICPFGQKSLMAGETPANLLNGKCLTFFPFFTSSLNKVIFHQMYPYVGAASIVQQLTQTYDRRSKTTQQDVREKSKSSLSDSCLSWPSCGARCTWP